MFTDVAKIMIKAGDGGDGAVAFHREKYVASGGPDGGDGGRGGDVVFVVDDNLSSLLDFRYKRKFTAERGENGRGARCFGKNGKDLIIKVPRGTLIRNAETGRLMQDMSGDEPFVAAKGGRGGWGNAHFATPTRQAPRFAKSGGKGECFEITLEMKLIADVGLLGFPNVGKSTLLSMVSAARPKIANYHFTTLEPQLGVVRLDAETSFVMADIPGLIEGASEGIGLGLSFLRHVERCRLLVHIVDISGSEGRDPVEDFEKINLELEKFSPELMERPQIVVGNKTDLITDDRQLADRFRAYVEERGYPYLEMSAATATGTKAVIDRVAEELAKLPPVLVYEPEPELYESEKNERETIIEVVDGVYEVSGEWLERLLGSVNFSDHDSLQYLHKVLTRGNVYAMLEEKGIKDGDTVSIYGVQFDYIK